jgi:hypothetical protein
MGNRLAPILAILFMDRIEIQAIYSDQALFLPLYYRYIDDCITPASGPDEAVKIQDKLNSQDTSIPFEIELPGEDGFLPFLNTKVKVNESGTVETGWQTKSANKGIMLNEKSHHPEKIKRAAIVIPSRHILPYVQPTPCLKKLNGSLKEERDETAMATTI